MEHLGAVQSVAQNLNDALQNPLLKELCSFWGYESELESLERTVNTVKAVLLDVVKSNEAKRELSYQAQMWVDELKDVVYDADDLLDKFVTFAEQQQLRAKDGEGHNLFTKVRRLFSFDNPLLFAFNMSRGVKEIRNKLDAIAQNHSQFGFKLDSQPIRRRREETCSYVYAQDIIGRKDDVENIVGRLLDPHVQQNVSCLTVVGIGGLGKTTLAQLVYNDPRIEENFPLRLWTCIADQDVKHLDVKATLCKILHSATGEKHEHLSMDHLQKQLQDKLAGKKYFLVLDDVWNEVRDQWLELAKFLMSGLKGSWILLTTRSEETVAAVGDEHPYKLKGLSEEDSWGLFVRTAFGQRPKQANIDLVEIGQEIVKRCANIPLAIRVVGTLLYGQDKKKWLLLKEVGLGRITQGEKGIKPILKLSYNNLESPLKICFSYCAIFPKDFEMEKEMLINLWIAQGFVIPLDEGQNLEDASEEYFFILLKRCFFQDVRENQNGEIVACKIHDLMHDIAQEVAGKEVHIANSIPSGLNDKIRHLSYSHFAGDLDAKSSFTTLKIRTCLRISHIGQWYKSDLALHSLLANWICLRALDLSHSKIKILPDILGKLMHLRYLDLSWNFDLEVLPNSITELHNLETLKLAGCGKLRELPEDLCKLTKLRVLDTIGCQRLARMPRGMGKLNSLKKLPFLEVGERTSGPEGAQLVDQLEEIQALKNLKGDLCIWITIPTTAKYVIQNGTKGGYLSQHQHLTDITVRYTKRDFEHVGKRVYDIDEAVLEDLQPHPNLRGLELEGYGGGRMPKWAREENLTIFLPNLVCIKLEACHNLQHLALLGKLHKLKCLVLVDLSDLEYIQNTEISNSYIGVRALESEELFFPALEQLVLSDLPKLKGWWKDDSNVSQDHGLSLPSLPCVSYLRIFKCLNLACMPLCPRVERLTIVGCNVNLRIMKTIESGNSKLRSVHTSNVSHLKLALPVEAFQHLNSMIISSDSEVENLSEVEEVFCCCSSSLRTLEIRCCLKLKIVCDGLEHLTALEKEEGEDDDMPWCCLHHCLRSLELNNLPNLVNLPNGMRYLTALQSLEIRDCASLKSLPEWMPELTSLKQLKIQHCSQSLKERCRDLTGEDWPNIQQIPDINIF